MALPDIRHRTGYLFIAVMVGHIILISAQVNSRTGVPILQAALFGGFAQLQRLAWSIQAGVRDVWDGYVALRDVRAENQALAREVADLRVRMQEERALSRTAESLRTLLDLRARLPLLTAAAEVVAGSATPEFRSITINKGKQSGVQLDMAVIAPAGIVGRVVMPGANAATVQLLVDSNAATAVTVARSGAQGILLARPDGTLRLEFLPSAAEVQRGDLVVTAGTDRVYPKGLTVGTVELIEGAGATRVVTVRPAVELSSLQTVLVVLGESAPPAKPPGTP
jgi:rod shape-determining protein MreC